MGNMDETGKFNLIRLKRTLQGVKIGTYREGK